ncbi:MAG TPA: spiro-SPASM protein, partial [Spirochaetia bacterium]|nr:spiro-SPASM protein [Spirochaetia bacterium]
MRNIAVINGTDLREPAFRPLRDGRSSFALAVQFALELPGVAETVVLLSRETELPAGARPVVRASWTLASLLEQIAGAAEGFDHVCYLYGDCPFLDSVIARRMQESHVRHWADYTFADGYPAGVTVEILSRQTVGRLRAMADGPEGQAAPRRDSLFTVIRKDINSFDIETEISPTDMRLLRVSLTADTERNFLLLSRIVAAGAVTPEAAIRFLQDNPGAHRTLPAFFPVQVVEQCPQACTYCPYPRFAGDVLHRKGFMPVEAFAGLARKISAFAGDAVIDISLWGEPSLHPQVFDLIQAGRDTPGIELLIETSGIGWPAGTFERIKARGGTPPRWIVSLDAATEPVYRALRGEGFA